jgi:hypothetical protein
MDIHGCDTNDEIVKLFNKVFKKTEDLELGAVDKLLVGIFDGCDGEGKTSESSPSSPSILQWYAPVKIIGIKIIVPIKSEKSLRLMVHISKPLTNH